MKNLEVEIEERFSFLKRYIGEKITSLLSTPYWSEKIHLISSNTAIVSTTAGPLYFACAYYQADMFYSEGEDVLFSVTEGRGDIDYVSLDSIPLETETENETILDISLVYDEVANSERTLRYPVGVFLLTAKGNIAVWRDSMDVFLLGFDARNAGYDELWDIDELWSGFLSVPPFSVKRIAYSYLKGERSMIDERKYFPPDDEEE